MNLEKILEKKGLDGIEDNSKIIEKYIDRYDPTLPEAKRIYMGIKRKIDKKDGLFYRDQWDKSCRWTRENAAFGLLCYLLNKKEEAEGIYKTIKNKIGKERGLYNLGIYEYNNHINHIDKDKWTEANAMMALLCYSLGRKREAKRIYRRINWKIGMWGGLYKKSRHKNPMYFYEYDYDRERNTSTNAAMGAVCRVLGKKKKAEGLYEVVNIRIGKEKRLYKHGIIKRYENIHVDKEKRTSNNAMMGIFCCMHGKKEEAKELFKEINSQIGKRKRLLYNWCRKDTRTPLYDNALMGILGHLLSKKGPGIFS